MSALLAQVEVAPEGLSSSLFAPLFIVAIVYVVLYIAATVIENRGDPRGRTLADLAFALLLLIGVYVAVLLILALAQRFDLISRMAGTIAIVVAFFAILLVVLFGIGQLFGLIARAVRRDERVTTAAADDTSG